MGSLLDIYIINATTLSNSNLYIQSLESQLLFAKYRL